MTLILVVMGPVFALYLGGAAACWIYDQRERREEAFRAEVRRRAQARRRAGTEDYT